MDGQLSKINSADLIQPNQSSFWFALFADYFIVAGCLILGSRSLDGNPMLWFLWPLLWFIVGSRQHALLILMHETSHGLALRSSRLNDFVGDIFCAAPFFVKMRSYRADHLAHHKWNNTNRDPDWIRKHANAKVREGWTYPKDILNFRFGLRFWQNAIAYHFASVDRANSAIELVEKKQHKFMRGTAYLATIMIIFLMGFLEEFLLFWVFPFVFVTPVLLRIRSVAEHFGLPYKDTYSETRDVVFRNRFEQYIFAPHNIGYHLTHHLYANVPMSALPRLQNRLAQNSDYAQRAQVNDGYFSGLNPVFRDLTTIQAQRCLWKNEEPQHDV